MKVQAHPDSYNVKFFPHDGSGSFAVVEAIEGDASVSIFLTTAAECDELIRAAAEAKRLLTGHGETPADTAEPLPQWERNLLERQARGENPYANQAQWCPAFTRLDDEGVTLYCDRPPGHAGSHHAPGPDEGSEVAWSGEAEGEQP